VLIGSLAAADVIGGGGDNPVLPRPPVTATSGDATSSSAGGFDRITQYGGTWMSDNSAPDTIARIAIAGSGPLVNVHAFAACAPVDCELGHEVAVVRRSARRSLRGWRTVVRRS
jgi:hypothetical protein